MPDEIDLPLPDPGSLTRGRFTYFPVVPGTAGVRGGSAPRDPARAAAGGSRGTSHHAAGGVSAKPSRDFRRSRSSSTPTNGEEARAVYVPVEPADPFTEAIRTALEIGAELVFADPDTGERPTFKTLIRIPTRCARSGWRNTWRRTAFILRRAPKNLPGTRMASPGSCRGPTRWRASWWWSR